MCEGKEGLVESLIEREEADYLTDKDEAVTKALETRDVLLKYLEKEAERLKGQIQAANQKINAANWAHHLQESGLHPYCNAPYPED